MTTSPQLTAKIDPDAVSAAVSVDWSGLRTNLLSNPSMNRGSTTGYSRAGTGYGASTYVSGITDHPVPGITRAFQCSAPTGSVNIGVSNRTFLNVVPGQAYMMTVWVKQTVGADAWTAALNWYDLNDAYLGAANGQAYQVNVGEWTMLYVYGVAPAKALHLWAYVRIMSTLTHAVDYLITGFLLEAAPPPLPDGTAPVYPGDYFDGDTTGYATVPLGQNYVTTYTYKWNPTDKSGVSEERLAEQPPTTNIVRVQSDGTMLPVRNAEPATGLVLGAWVGTDYEAPLDSDFYYTATADAYPGRVITSPTYRIDSAGRSMLKHPGRPALNAPVRVEAGPSLTRPVSQGVFEVLGRSTPVALSMRRSAARGELSLITLDAAERDALLLLLDDGTPLLLQTPDGYGIGNVYIAVGEVTEERPGRLGAEWARRWSLPFYVVDRPTGAALAVGNTWADVLAAYASWDDMRNVERTWAGVLEGLGS